MILRCVKLRDAIFVMYKSPERLRQKCEIREKVEKLFLFTWQYQSRQYQQTQTSPRTKYIQFTLRIKFTNLFVQIYFSIQLKIRDTY